PATPCRRWVTVAGSVKPARRGIGGDATMSKQASKRKRVTKAALPALGAAGLTFSLAGGASASALPNADTPQKLNFSPSQSVLLGEEEIADATLSTFHLFDKEHGTA